MLPHAQSKGPVVNRPPPCSIKETLAARGGRELSAVALGLSAADQIDVKKIRLPPGFVCALPSEWN
jgi:hypothetical protein